jgi:hypothetical protein
MRPCNAMRLLAGIACALALALASSGCGGSSAVSATALDPVAQAAELTSHAGGAHMALSMQMTGAGLPQPFTVSGQGFFNYRSQEGMLAIDAAGLPAGATANLPPGGLHIEAIFKSSTIYVGSPLFAGKLPGGARWMKLDLGRFAQTIGLNIQQLAGGQANPAQFINFLKATSGPPQRIGNELVRGVQTTRYHATIDLSKLARVLSSADASKLRPAIDKLIAQAGTSKIPVDVWVDEQHLVRRITFSFAFSTAGQSPHMSMTVELFDFGPTPSVQPPQASEVFDATKLALTKLNSSGG